jgi:hypothetical protein
MDLPGGLLSQRGVAMLGGVEGLEGGQRLAEVRPIANLLKAVVPVGR